MKKSLILLITLLLALAVLAVGCSGGSTPGDGNTIQLSDKGISTPSGVSASGSTVTVRTGGTYRVAGSLSEGQLVVDAEDKAVTLILDNADISNSTGPAILAENVKSLTVQLADNSRNSLTSGKPVEITSQAADSDASGGAIQAKADLTITGEGSLTVGGYLNNGISTSKTLTVESGTLEISAIHHGLRGKDRLIANGGDVSVTASGDGLHSDQEIVMAGGSYTITVFDDGIHADNTLTVEEGNISILQSEEGLEANYVTINGGSLSIVSSDDGINAGGTGSVLTINGGQISINADGDGLDSNKDCIINGGWVLVEGPSSSNNAALDAGQENGGKLVVNGGTVLALGSSGMASAFDGTSAQCSFLYAGQQLTPGSELVISDIRGQELARHTVTKAAGCVIFSSNSLVQGENVTLTLDGTAVEITLSEIATSVGGGMGGMGGFGGKGGHMRGDFSPEGQPEMPEGMEGGFPEGERPQMSGREGRPDFPMNEDGERPDFPMNENGERPSFPEGGRPEMPPEDQI